MTASIPPSAPRGKVSAAGFAALLPDYTPPPGHFDELLEGDRTLRAHWRGFTEQPAGVGADDLARKQARLAQQIHDNGITYNVYAAADGPRRPWALDVVPLVLPAAEWEPLTVGLRQRARLLDALAADFYGAQRLLAGGFVPPALVFAHPGFLRACHGVSPPGGVFVHQVGFDLARGPDGRWRVVATRAQAPSGAGYALENRVTVSRLFPDAFRAMRVHTLAPFFRTLQETLLAGAPCGDEAPHVVLLTPGPYNETYFEHAYLARYLGFTLAEGGDLTVRDDMLYLKTLSGLERVHAVLRRLDDDFCDPLELRADSTLGVPGLVQAWRAGNVLVANAFGTSVLESPALSGFLPAACEQMLSETLAVPSLATWWCGEQTALAEAETQLEQLVVKPAFGYPPQDPVFLADLDRAGRERWSQRIRATPERYLLQQHLPLSHAPAWHDGRLASRALMLRVFLVSDGRGDYRVLPGGLARIAGSERHVVSGQRGGSSKDTWVLSDAPVEAFSLLPGRLHVEDIARSERIVSSRAGESLFWLGRYAERSENAARLLRAVLARLPYGDALSPALLSAFIGACHRQALLEDDPEDYTDAPLRLQRDLLDGLFDAEHSPSLAFNVRQTARVAAGVRDRLSTDNWRIVNQLYQAFEKPVRRGSGLADALELIDKAIMHLVAVGGLEMAHMTRDEGWRFLGLGRLVERLLFVTATTGEVVAAKNPDEPALLEWLLDLSDSTITYRSRYMRQPEWLAVAHLLLFDDRNPRSAAFQLGKLAKHTRLLPEADFTLLAGEIEAAADACAAALDPEHGLLARRDALEDFLGDCVGLALRLSDALTLRYFSHVDEPTRTTAMF
jgi:uncharacterized circularly permuted ATP-grasp superfamily protein/uncharacterized alpha-E superfamily protein